MTDPVFLDALDTDYDCQTSDREYKGVVKVNGFDFARLMDLARRGASK